MNGKYSLLDGWLRLQWPLQHQIFMLFTIYMEISYLGSVAGAVVADLGIIYVMIV